LEAVAADAKAPVLMSWQRELLGLEALPEVPETEPESAEAA